MRRLRDAGAPPHLDPVGLFTVVAADAGIERRVIQLRGVVEPRLRGLARMTVGVDVSRVCRTTNHSRFPPSDPSSKSISNMKCL